jgi:hypothetical protein
MGGKRRDIRRLSVFQSKFHFPLTHHVLGVYFTVWVKCRWQKGLETS